MHLHDLFARDLGEAAAAAFPGVNFREIDGQDICQVTAEPSDHPVYMEHQQEAIFYLRVGNGTRPLAVKEAVQYVGQHHPTYPHQPSRTRLAERQPGGSLVLR